MSLQGGSDDLFSPDLPDGGGANQLELLADLRNFLAFQAVRDGQATTAELVARFKSRVPPGESPLFRALLNQICDFHKSSDTRGEGLWTLKREFA